MELIMQTDLTVAIPQELTFNFEELEAEITERLKYYNGLIVTEDTIKEAKDDRAALNRLRTALEDKRKEVKKLCLVPSNNFEAKEKKLIAPIDQAIANIDSQLKAFEDAKKAEKQAEIEAYYKETVAEYLQTVIPLARIQQRDWLNATKAMSKIKTEIDEAVARVTADLEVLNTMPTDDFTAAVRAKYMETLDLTAALAHRKSLQAAADAFNATQATMPTPPPVRMTQPERAPERAPSEPAEQTERVFLLRLEMHLTKAQGDALKKFLTDTGINYKKI